jgi:prolyl-tRNA editing enzyme YbaK/EbsC (Cys-tRNA(Pro) deacylase)
MKDKIVESYCKKLDALGIKHELLKHPEMREVKDVMDYLGLPLSMGYSTLVMKADGEFVAIIRRDDTKLSPKKAKKVLGASALRMATSSEFEKLTGIPSGA